MWFPYSAAQQPVHFKLQALVGSIKIAHGILQLCFSLFSFCLWYPRRQPLMIKFSNRRFSHRDQYPSTGSSPVCASYYRGQGQPPGWHPSAFSKYPSCQNGQTSPGASAGSSPGPYPCRRAPILLQMLPHFLLMPLFFTSLFFCFYVLIIYWPSCFFAAGKSGMRLRNYKHKGVGCTHSTLSIWRRYHIREKTYSQRTTTK